jgi:hypothetical protein
MRIKLFESFTDENKVKSDIEDIFVELCDSGFNLQVKTWEKDDWKLRYKASYRGSYITIDIERNDKQLFECSILEEYDLMLRDYLDDALPGYKIGDYLFYSNNRGFENSEYIREHEIPSGYSPRVVINIIGEDKVSESVEYSEDKILQEVDELLVELRDSKFDVHSNFIVKDGKNILELWVEKEEPDFDEVEYEDWYEEGGNRFIIGDVYEPLALLTDWMSEKYGAELVDDGMNSDTFELKGGEFQMRDSEVFDPEWKEIQRKYYGENYLKKKVAALFVKYVW